jgi:hypothetical protein
MTPLAVLHEPGWARCRPSRTTPRHATCSQTLIDAARDIPPSQGSEFVIYDRQGRICPGGEVHELQQTAEEAA